MTVEGWIVRWIRMTWCLVAAVGVALAAVGQEGNVKAWEGEITIPTYPIYGADVNPKIYELEGSIVYPYTMQDHLTTIKEDRTYRAVCLENEYLKVTCLPQLGGRIHSVLDKTTGEQMFHLNHVIKPGLIAMRGAWISGGIEWNRGPQGHTVTSFAPVNVTSRPNPDGSASLVIGYTEANFHTRWNVTLTLRPGKAYLDEAIRIYNPTDGTHSFYFWNNTAFPCEPGTRFIYPMTLGTDHAGTTFFHWPIDNGRDLTWLKNYDKPTSVFAYECAFDFFGAYDVDRDRGIVQYGNHEIVTGKKAWTWGQSGDGLASQAALTDDDGPYIEVQSGPLRTQADYGLLGPHEEIAWREWWYPVHGLGDGFEYATQDAAVQTYRNDGDLEVRVLTTGVYDGAKCTFSRDGQTIGANAVDLSPMKPVVMKQAGAADRPVQIRVESAAGAVLAEYTSPLPIPERTPPAKTEADPVDTAEEAWLEGVTAEERIQRTNARAAYERALTFDPGFVPALRSLAVLDLEAGLYDDAAEGLEQALKRNPEDGMSWYYLGVARLKQDRLDEAESCGYRVIDQLDERSLGYDLVGRALMRQGKYADAVPAFRQAMTLNPTDSRARDHWLTALHGAGEHQQLLDGVAAAHAADPLDFVTGALVALQDPSYLPGFIDEMKGTMGPYQSEMIRLSLYFDDLGLTREAFQLLDAAYARFAPAVHQITYYPGKPPVDLRDRPLPWYVMAYYASKLNLQNEETRCLRKSQTVYGNYAFPSQPVYERILKHAIEKNPEDSRAHLYLGNLYGGLGRLDEAKAEWEAAAALPGALSVAYRNLGLYAWKKDEDLSKAERLYQQAIAAFPGDQTLYRDEANILIADKKPDEAIAVLEGMPLNRARRGDVTVLLARTYNDVHRYDDTIALLDDAFFSNWENNSLSWRVWSQAHVERGKQRMDAGDAKSALTDFEAALTYPENLGVGRPADPEEAEVLFWKGKALAALNRMDEAKATWQSGAGGHAGSDTQNEYVKRCKEALAAGAQA